MRKINVSEFCKQSGINEDIFGDTIEAMGLDRTTDELELNILEAIAQEIASKNGTQLALPASTTNVSAEEQIAVTEAVGLAFEIYPEALALNDLQVVQLAAFLTAERQVEAYEAIHSAVIRQRLEEYRVKTNTQFLDSVNATREASDADFLIARGIVPNQSQNNSVLSELLKMGRRTA